MGNHLRCFWCRCILKAKWVNLVMATTTTQTIRVKLTAVQWTATLRQRDTAERLQRDRQHDKQQQCTADNRGRGSV